LEEQVTDQKIKKKKIRKSVPFGVSGSDQMKVESWCIIEVKTFEKSS